jgi:putative ABC transport system permease protein
MTGIDGLARIPKMALRNIWRSRRRSVITMLSICVGTLALILLSGYILLMDGGLKSNTIEKETGYFQIVKKGYLADDATSLRHVIDEAEAAKIEDYLSTMEEVTSVTRRLELVGMIGTPRNSAVFMGICDSTDTLVSMVPSIVEGATLSSSDPEGIVIGKKLADKLEIKVGDPVILFVSTENGAPEAVSAAVRGIYKGLLAEQENMLIYMPIDTAWSLMLEKPTQRLIVFLDGLGDLDAAMRKTEDFIVAGGYDLEIRSWRDLALMYRQIIGMFSSMVALAGGIIFLVIIFGISNTMYMAVHDRTHEIGTMRALGKRRGYIVGLFFTEGIIMGILGALMGIIIALALIPLVNSLKLNLPPGPGQTDPIPLMFAMNGWIVLLVMFVNAGSAALASLFPSWKASRQKIADSLRFS